MDINFSAVEAISVKINSQGTGKTGMESIFFC